MSFEWKDTSYGTPDEMSDLGIRLQRVFPYMGSIMIKLNTIQSEKKDEGAAIMHQENRCDECGTFNFLWWVAGDRRHLAVGEPNGPVLCPACFVSRWEAATGMTCSWRLEPRVSDILSGLRDLLDIRDRELLKVEHDRDAYNKRAQDAEAKLVSANAKLAAIYTAEAEAMALVISHEGRIAAVEKERDEALAKLLQERVGQLEQVFELPPDEKPGG